MAVLFCLRQICETEKEMKKKKKSHPKPLASNTVTQSPKKPALRTEYFRPNLEDPETQVAALISADANVSETNTWITTEKLISAISHTPSPPVPKQLPITPEKGPSPTSGRLLSPSDRSSVFTRAPPVENGDVVTLLSESSSSRQSTARTFSSRAPPSRREKSTTMEYILSYLQQLERVQQC
ncbi:uncharacterized protein LOC111083830 [Limulus polyphemus]|uniref:Uncharacterized protein LOC111083830 n=1 Tax=Limulus polyphemus TaxID=6850 RepID=A0ABM1RXX9_LIMPO|nr:uncharacterized protein LOC111083830 [Limulus polyphemus]